MKKYYVFIVLFLLNCFTAQEVKLTHIEKEIESSDAFLYRIENLDKATCLGELDIEGFSIEDENMFTEIYHTAKQIGANAFAYKKIFDISGEEKSFNSHHYQLQLYHIKKQYLPSVNNTLFIFGHSKKDLKIRFNNKKRKVLSRTYYEVPLENNQVYKIATNSFLGSSMKFTASENEDSKYYQLLTNTLQGENGFLGYKSTDIGVIKRSYADFLSVIYEKIKLNN